jgi:hypothetical protein
VVEIGCQFILEAFLVLEGLKTGKIRSGFPVKTRQADEFWRTEASSLEGLDRGFQLLPARSSGLDEFADGLSHDGSDPFVVE